MRAFPPCLTGCLAGAVICLATSSRAQEMSAPEKVVEAFVQHCRDGDFANADQAIQAVSALREDPLAAPGAVTAGLRLLYPEFQTALNALSEEDFATADLLLEALSASDDPYLATEARFYRARAGTLQERFDKALPLLVDITEKRATRTGMLGDAWFLRGVAEARLLRRPAAIESLETFLEKYPAASERMRVGAQRQLEQLQAIEEESIADAFERMDFARRRLAQGEAGKETQSQQEKIIDILAKLIEEAEENEASGSGQGQGQSSGQGQGEGSKDGNQQNPGEGTGEGENDQSPEAEVKRIYRRGPTSPWGHLRDKERDPAYNAIKTRFPPRYEKLIEQYYKSFQDK
ncbi:tetratricopeptide repeat protein [Lignipirellula cremea]|uniref:Outer membrane protein assembly factor BamD n=1 Tax=Lignipirellula cremea TaxID=2528010 RepID=A0A518E3T9_9BACT|nr:hypothetical protein [Lignipirellula cremea]QDU98757.1 hypothetical protein Pla8534_66300 [Lignipirellula cremea]